jgi:hypothetical protein
MAKNLQAIIIPKYTIKSFLVAVRWQTTVKTIHKTHRRSLLNGYPDADLYLLSSSDQNDFAYNTGRKTRAIDKNCKIPNDFLTQRHFPGKAFSFQWKG